MAERSLESIMPIDDVDDGESAGESAGERVLESSFFSLVGSPNY